MDAIIITIGDEILAGDITNEDATWLSKKLRERGIKVKRIVVIPDEVDTIVEELKEVDKYDYIFMTGGLGSTHDDVTRDALSIYLDKDLIPIDDEDYADFMGTSLQKMIEIPEGTKPIYNAVGGAIGVMINDKIFVLPGVPEEMKAMFSSIEDKFRGEEIHTKWIDTQRFESQIGKILEEAEKRFRVKVGSYPKRNDEGYFLKIKLESEDGGELERAYAWIKDEI
ncbi:MAG: competence damage-inducible protein A [Candidatus Methanolliviera sp. GoM_asphalt]|nr:MAG: competence damage-inducible protein A [Candidatus Methanolliviera sp. GoM_asphalt]